MTVVLGNWSSRQRRDCGTALTAAMGEQQSTSLPNTATLTCARLRFQSKSTLDWVPFTVPTVLWLPSPKAPGPGRLQRRRTGDPRGVAGDIQDVHGGLC